MKIFLTGQRSFGKAVLLALQEDGHDIVGVAPAPPGQYYDKLHAIALRYKVPVVCDATRLTSAHIPEGTDLIISAHSHWYVSDKAVEKAWLGAIGYHPSLLPRHRGRDAVRWTIACGDAVTGGRKARFHASILYVSLRMTAIASGVWSGISRRGRTETVAFTLFQGAKATGCGACSVRRLLVFRCRAEVRLVTDGAVHSAERLQWHVLYLATEREMGEIE